MGFIGYEKAFDSVKTFAAMKTLRKQVVEDMWVH